MKKLLALSFLIVVMGGEGVAETKLPIPRFASLRSDKVNVRVGPGKRYPIDWVFVRRKMPVKIIQEFGAWRLVQDYEGAEGWIHQQMLSGLRTVQVIGIKPQFLFKEAKKEAPRIAIVEAGAIGQMLRMDETWCQIKFEGGYKGWMQHDSLWGSSTY